RLFAGVRRNLGLAAHDDGFFGTGIDAEAAEDAAQHIDLEARRRLFNQRVGDLLRLDVDAIRRAGRRAHVAGDAARAAVFARRQDVRAAIAVRVGAALLRVADRG